MATLPPDPPNLGRQVTAEQLGVSPVTLDRWVRLGLFPKPIKLGRSRNSPTRWRQSTINEWVDAQAKGAAQG